MLKGISGVGESCLLLLELGEKDQVVAPGNLSNRLLDKSRIWPGQSEKGLWHLSPTKLPAARAQVDFPQPALRLIPIPPQRGPESTKA